MAQISRTQVRRRNGEPLPESQPTGAPSIQGRAPGQVRNLKGVLFGPPKTGKTTLACSGTNVLLISFDPDGDATETLAGRSDITVVTPRSQAEVDQIIRALHTTDEGRFDWVVVDSLTFLFLMLGGKEITDTFKENKDIRRAYGRTGAAVQQIIHDLVLLDTNVVFTAHLERVGTEDDNGVPLDTKLGENEVKIAVSPMVWRILGPAVSFQGRTFKETVYDTVTEGGKKKRNKRTRFAVSFNDGDRSPAGARLPMKGEYESTGTTLAELAEELVKGD